MQQQDKSTFVMTAADLRELWDAAPGSPSSLRIRWYSRALAGTRRYLRVTAAASRGGGAGPRVGAAR